MIFLIGRYPFRSGVFNVMYYTIVKRLLKYVMAMLIMVLFFAFAFMILHFGPDSKSFRSPLKVSDAIKSYYLNHIPFLLEYHENIHNDSRRIHI